jgi:hypothetical protein
VGATTGRVPWPFELVLGLAFVPAYDFRYDFYEEVRDRSTQSVPQDRVIADTYLEGDGDLRAVTFGLAKEFHGNLCLGGSIDYLFGDYHIKARLVRSEAAGGDEGETSDRIAASNLSGVRFRFGAAYRLSKRIEVGMDFESQCELEGDFESRSSDDDLLSFLPMAGIGDETIAATYPQSYGVGLTFRPRNELLTVIEADMKYTRWSDFSNEAYDGLHLDDTYEWHVGVEHVFYNGRPVQFGFIYKPSPIDKEIGEAAVTAGSAITLSGFDIGFSAKVAWREYRHPDVFDDSLFGAQSRQLTDLVEETVFGGNISISRTF